MTDAVQAGTEWVPRFGMLEVPRDRAELIRGLFELAAFVADHPKLPLPQVNARFFTPLLGSAASEAEEYQAARALVEEVAAALDVAASEDDGEYRIRTALGAVQLLSIAYSPERWARYEASQSYRRNVVTETAAGGAR
jgi:hypothetical protein